ncbi:MAG: tetratricopeptide repeat protein [Nitrospiraceae bacterium]|nr:tetratricopeptide repeat protein [Nitrospiraceae bacterium]
MSRARVQRLKTLLFLGLGFIGSLDARAQLPSITESSGRYKDPIEQASTAYSRGARALKKAEKQLAAGESEKAHQSFARAKEDFSKAISLHPSYFDAMLGLGRAYLGLGNHESAKDACGRALGLQPNHLEARKCFDAALAAETTPTVSNDGSNQ